MICYSIERLSVRIHHALLLLILLSSIACAPGRREVPPGHIPKPLPLTVTEEQLGHQALDALSQKYELTYDHPRYSNVIEIVERITAAAKADKDPWHVYVFKDAEFKNAAATRGNHVFIWTPMIDATQNDDELAAVLAHEIGHVLARHTDPDGNEQIKKVLINVGAMAAGIAAAQVAGAQIGQTAGQLAQGATSELGNSLLLYPYSRDRELEADSVGLFLMADANYNPAAALDFWARAQSDPSFGSGLAFFSTHPPAEERLEKLRVLLPQAKARYLGHASPPPPFDVYGSASSPSTARSSQSSQRTEDSFDVSSAASDNVRSWTVRSDGTPLFTTADPSSLAIGEFRKGATVYSVEEIEGWVRIIEPEGGWLSRSALEPLASQR